MLWLAGLNPATLEAVRRSALGEILSEDHMIFNVQEAVQRYLDAGPGDS